jgi:hypothetical protein
MLSVRTELAVHQCLEDFVFRSEDISFSKADAGRIQKLNRFVGVNYFKELDLIFS